MSKPSVPKAILAKVKRITGKRSRVVVDHILKYGSITTEELKNYGYEHPPRAIRDVVEQGLPLAREWTNDSKGRKIARYRFGDPADVRHDRTGGRKVIPKVLHKAVCESTGGRCAICSTPYDSRYLQTDHRIPFEVVGDAAGREVEDYMPLCGSCNRAKSWSCEHCPNWETRAVAVCATCYWAKPNDYGHVATRDIRRLELVWQGEESADYDAATSAAEGRELSLPDFVKDVLRKAISDSG